MPALVEYHLITPQSGIPPFQAHLYDYLFAGNGVLIRSKRPGLEVILPVTTQEIRGLAPIEPLVRFTYPPVPQHLVEQILWCAQGAIGEEGNPVEILFHLEWRDEEWQLTIPEQKQTATSVVPTDDSAGSSYATALIDLHSHHGMQAFFSATDNRDEQGFRIYAVLGNIFKRPELLVRVGCEGVHWIIPATTVFELPEGLIDASIPLSEQDEDGDLNPEHDDEEASEL
ncbi:hypothetical protein KDA_75950 [Dictyobacter alpinus]|uniref:JAB domain-containing protein n=1 Tax=Dictyobacter alpinus TaxID=2014873 RepID=A0A402BL88_9CHLR|nr:Mov34/MPN/PAD-1 family protein [Dictyobacter alpinus]GCE32111.1 hypothetical protein KDA_75950 [Dictyobacter alpinus]